MPDVTVPAHTGPGNATRAPVVAILYYVVAGLAAGGLAVLNSLGLVSAVTSGCRLLASQDLPELRANRTGESGGCLHSIDAPNILLTFAVAAILIMAVWQLTRPASRWGARTAMGVLVGVVVGFTPLLFIAWAVDFYRFALGPVELGVALLPLAWAFSSAVLVWRTARTVKQPA